MIIDSAGVPVWYRRGTAGRSPAISSASPTVRWRGSRRSDPGSASIRPTASRTSRSSGTPVDLIQTVGAPTNHHELVQLPNGNFLLTAMLYLPPPPDAQPCRLQNAAGTFPAITSDHVLRALVQEVTPAGALVRDWDSFGEIVDDNETTVPICFRVDHRLSQLDPSECSRISTPTGRGPPTTNSSCPVATTTPSTRSTSTAETVDWKLGGTNRAESLTIVGDPLNGPRSSARRPRAPQRPHHDVRQPHQLHERLAAVVPVTGAARYVEYAIDETARTATMVREIRNPNGFFSGATGSARLQPDGGVVICWGALPGTVFSEYDADGEVLFEVHMPGLNSSYRTVKEPLGSFDIAELRQTAGR